MRSSCSLSHLTQFCGTFCGHVSWQVTCLRLIKQSPRLHCGHLCSRVSIFFKPELAKTKTGKRQVQVCGWGWWNPTYPKMVSFVPLLYSTHLPLKVSRDTFHFPWNVNFLFSVLRMVQGEAKTPKNNGVFHGKFCLFTCPKDRYFSWKMNIRMSSDS